MEVQCLIWDPLQVAEFAIQGVERGYFFARSPDFMSNLAISSCSGVAPKLFNSFLEFLLLPIYYLIHVTVRRSIDKRILRWRKEEPAELKIKSQSTSGKLTSHHCHFELRLMKMPSLFSLMHPWGLWCKFEAHVVTSVVVRILEIIRLRSQCNLFMLAWELKSTLRMSRWRGRYTVMMHHYAICFKCCFRTDYCLTCSYCKA